MIKIEKWEVDGWNAAIRGMRNPLESWDKSDSIYCTGYRTNKNECANCVLFDYGECANFEELPVFTLGAKDLELMQTLCAAGSDERKFMRMLHVSMDVTAPIFWWSEYDTYKVGTVRNSCSKMHRIHVHPITADNFTTEGIDAVGGYAREVFENVVGLCEALQENFNETKNRNFWRALIEILPEGYNMKATIDFNYENALNMYRARHNHKLTEWHEFCDTLLELPYFKDITGKLLKFN